MSTQIVKNFFAWTIISGFFFGSLTSCHKDDEDAAPKVDTVKLMNEIRAMNEAGELLSFTIQVVDNTVPVQGVSVTISNDVSSALNAETQTQANGAASFQKVRVGRNSVVISKTDYLSATAFFNFGSLSNYYTLVKDAAGNITDITPNKKTKTAVLQIFSQSLASASTAKLQGHISIETDITNQVPEVPQNLIIKAGLSADLAMNSASEGVTIESYTFNSGGICEAAVDNVTGNYSMIVPASAAGYPLALIIPILETTQKIAVSRLNGNDITPEFRNVPVQFGPEVGFDATLPVVPGISAVFPTPPPAGTGLTFTLNAVPRPLHADNDVFVEYSPAVVFEYGETAYQLTSRGSGYASSPTISISGGGGTGATMTASLQGYTTGITVTNPGSGYTSDFTINVELVDMSDNVYLLNSFNVTNASDQLPATIPLPTAGYAFSANEMFKALTDQSVSEVKRLQATVAGDDGVNASVALTWNTEVEAIQLTAPGSGYTSAPAISFSGGGSTDQAVLAIKEFRSRWSIVPNNATNSSPYAVLPENIEFEFKSPYFTTYLDGDVLDNLDNQLSYWGELKTSGGQVVHSNGALAYRTNGYSAVVPAVVITPTISLKASVKVVLTNGIVTDFDNIVTGGGYNSVFGMTLQPTIAGVPGSGASVTLQGFSSNPVSGLSEWDGSFTITNPGSGYLQQLNLQNIAPASPAGAYDYSGPISPITVKTGEVKALNITYGTGKRKENVN